MSNHFGDILTPSFVYLTLDYFDKFIELKKIVFPTLKGNFPTRVSINKGETSNEISNKNLPSSTRT